MADIYEQLESCILLLDGGFGTMVQQYGLTEEDSVFPRKKYGNL